MIINIYISMDSGFKIWREMILKKVLINIASEDFSVLKENNYKLCVSFREKDMGYTMVSYADTEYLVNSILEVTEDYSVFCCSNIRSGQQVAVSVGPCTIELGQRITLDQYGLLGNVTGGGSANEIEIINEYGNIYPGFGRKIVFSGEENFQPVFVSTGVSVKGTFSLKPEDRIILWFEQLVESGQVLESNFESIVRAGKSTKIEVQLSDGETGVTYENGSWKKTS